jgi:hypothetical protein
MRELCQGYPSTFDRRIKCEVIDLETRATINTSLPNRHQNSSLDWDDASTCSESTPPSLMPQGKKTMILEIDFALGTAKSTP